MAISKKEVKKLSLLARVDIDENEIEEVQNSLEKILGFVSKLKDVSRNFISDQISVLNVVREDGAPHESGEYSESLLKQAPETEKGFIRVKKIL
jgi:aspartyl-tRNA(Asn)/glutamyl-tRNA(Gln) amidotransferase subunit C